MANSTYRLGCHDEDGHPIGEDLAIGENKNRIFDPDLYERYAATLPLPSEICIYNAGLDVTHLRYGDRYKPKKNDKYVDCGDGLYMESSTLVIEVGARTRNGLTLAARHFGANSKYNSYQWPQPERGPAQAIASIIDIGCQKTEKIVEQHAFIKKVIFMTSEIAIYQGIPHLWNWLRTGFPAEPGPGLSEEDFGLLYTNITHLEAKGVEVLFWLVEPEFIAGPHHLADGAFDDIDNLPVDKDKPCTCSNCIQGAQHRELTFARKGKEPCPCNPCRELVQKHGHLKKGETFLLTNNAGVEAPVTMLVDGEFAERAKINAKKAKQANT